MKDQEQMIPVWERALVRDIEKIAELIPLHRLAIQWDVPAEVGMLEHFFDYFSEPGAEALGADLARLAGHVPAGAEVGFHLCYGDAPPGEGKGRHWKEPGDTAIMVSLANAMFVASNRPVAWIHMPVPLERDDECVLPPLADLELPEETGLFLGLVHEEDGTEGAQKRIDVAARYVTGFGVATECGMGREPAGSVPGIMALHRDLVVPACRR